MFGHNIIEDIEEISQETQQVLSLKTDSSLGTVWDFDTDWAALHAQTSSPRTPFSNLQYLAEYTSMYSIYRGVFDIDFTPTAGKSVTSARIKLLASSDTADLYTGYIYVLNRATAGAISATDYANFGDKISALGVKTIEEYDGVDKLTVSFELNAAGLAYLQASGGTLSFMARAEEDADNTTPTTARPTNYVSVDAESSFMEVEENVGSGVLFKGDSSQVILNGSGNVQELINQDGTLDNATQTDPLLMPGIGANGILFDDKEKTLKSYLKGGQTIEQFTVAALLYNSDFPENTTSDYVFISLISCENTLNIFGFNFGLAIPPSEDQVRLRLWVNDSITNNYIQCAYTRLTWNSLFANKKTHFAATFDKGDVNIYIDGKRVINSSIAAPSAILTDSIREYIQFGNSSRGNSSYIDTIERFINKFYVSKKILSATDIYILSKNA